jgi:hypothetical protein
VVAVAEQVLADGLADAGTAALAQLTRQLVELPLQLGLHSHADHHGGTRATLHTTT